MIWDNELDGGRGQALVQYLGCGCSLVNCLASFLFMLLYVDDCPGLESVVVAELLLVLSRHSSCKHSQQHVRA
jgi:hypothetical protein